jgi:cation:H+ antiporter
VVLSSPLALLLLGLATIVWATHIVVENAVSVARHHRVSDFFIGAVVLAVGSDLPELVVTLHAAFRQLGGQETENLIIGNAIGSCFGQLGLVIGLGGLIGRLSLAREQLLRHGATLLAATLLLMLVGLDGRVSRLEAVVLVVVFIAYLYFVIKEEALTTDPRGPAAVGRLDKGGIAGHWVRLLIGMAAVVVSAELIVREALIVAVEWGVDQSFIGIAIVGVGTSLPEVVISIAAVLKGRTALSVGNLLGSNILDTLLPIGLGALIVPLDFSPAILRFDMPMLLGLTVLVLVFLFLRNGVRWPQGAVVLAAYCSYLLTLGRGL